MSKPGDPVIPEKRPADPLLEKHYGRRYECICPRCTERVYPCDYTYPECVHCFAGCGH